MKYAYEDLSPQQFEDLVIAICQDLLGAGVQGFATGPDGGRDAKFVGTAERHPSKAAPWHGTVIVQAKHTNGINKKFTDSDFYSEKAKKAGSTVLGEEIPRIRRLVKAKQLDHYMLCANRRLTGEGESDIRALLAKECGLPEQSIYLVGIEQIEQLLKLFPEASTRAGIDPRDSPLIVSPDELADVVEALVKQLPGVEIDSTPVDRVAYAEKNRRNKMSAEYSRTLRRRFLKDSRQIQAFLADPQNDGLLQRYLAAVDEFQLKIVAKRREYDSFDDVMNYLFDLLFKRDSTLRKHKTLTRAIVFYMYWNCDIGDDGEDDEDDCVA